ncbi:MAG: YceI family protein [Saprospiraceae bacterium]|nr:YceI family protein [Saprospiraceae bacterium]
MENTTSDTHLPIEYSTLLNPSSIKIEGTSTLHNWKSDAKDFSVKAKRHGSIISVQAMVQVASIKSGNSILDKKTIRSLKGKEFPTILLNARDLSIRNDQKIIGSGELTVAGKTQTLPLDLSLSSSADGSINVCADISINMTDFGIKPPVALMGTIRAGEVIVLKLDISLSGETV